MLFVSLPTTFARTERAAIVLALSSAFWMGTSYLALVFGDRIPVDLITLSWLLVSSIVFLHKHQSTVSNLHDFKNVKWKTLLSRVRDWSKHIRGPSPPIVFFFLCLIVLLLMSFQPIAPLDPEYTWNDPFIKPREPGEIRQFEFVTLLKSPQIIGLGVLFIIFMVAFLTEPRTEYVALLFLTMTVLVVLGPIMLLGRPWGIDTYTLAYFINGYENGNFGIADIYYPGYLDTIIQLFLKDVIDANVYETITILIPAFHCQIFLGLWILFKNSNMKLAKTRILLLLVSFTPILLQYCRIGSTLMSGVYFMLITVWFIEKRKRNRVEEEEVAWTDWWPALVFAALTPVHQVTALALLIYLMLRPVASILRTNMTVDNRSFPALLCTYISLELGQFFEWRATPMLNAIGFGGPLFSPLASIAIGPVSLVIRPIYGIIILGSYALVFLIAKSLERRQYFNRRERAIHGTYRLILIGGFAAGAVLSCFMVLDPSLLSPIERISASPVEIIIFYSVYIFMAMYIPYALSKTNQEKGFFILLYIVSYIAATLPQILFHIVEGGMVLRIVITIPLALGFISYPYDRHQYQSVLSKIIMGVCVSIMVLGGIVGSLLVHFYM